MKSWEKWVIKIAMELSVCMFYVAAIIIAWSALRGFMTALMVWPKAMSGLILFICVWALAISYGLVVIGNYFQNQMWQK